MVKRSRATCTIHLSFCAHRNVSFTSSNYLWGVNSPITIFYQLRTDQSPSWVSILVSSRSHLHSGCSIGDRSTVLFFCHCQSNRHCKCLCWSDVIYRERKLSIYTRQLNLGQSTHAVSQRARTNWREPCTLAGLWAQWSHHHLNQVNWPSRPSGLVVPIHTSAPVLFSLDRQLWQCRSWPSLRSSYFLRCAKGKLPIIVMFLFIFIGQPEVLRSSHSKRSCWSLFLVESDLLKCHYDRLIGFIVIGEEESYRPS